MVSFVVTGANRGLGVRACITSICETIDSSYSHNSLRLSRSWYVDLLKQTALTLEVITFQAEDHTNTVFALTRNKANSTDLLEFQAKSNNIHVLQADITDVPSLRVCLTHRHPFAFLNFDL